MRKLSKPLMFFCALFLAFYAQSARILLQESVDDFTDEVSNTLIFLDDSESSSLAVRCSNNQHVFLIIPDGMFESDSYVDVKFRFDKNEPYWEYQSNLYKAVENSHAVILLTAWDEYKTIDWGRVSLSVKSPFWVFDTRLILDTKNLKDLGLNFWQLGIGNNN